MRTRPRLLRLRAARSLHRAGTQPMAEHLREAALGVAVPGRAAEWWRGLGSEERAAVGGQKRVAANVEHALRPRWATAAAMQSMRMWWPAGGGVS